MTKCKNKKLDNKKLEKIFQILNKDIEKDSDEYYLQFGTVFIKKIFTLGLDINDIYSIENVLKIHNILNSQDKFLNVFTQ